VVFSIGATLFGLWIFKRFYFDTKKLNNKIVVKIKRNAKKIEKKVTLASLDPLLYRLKMHEPESCSQMHTKELPKKIKEEIHKKVFSPLHRFDCKTAHEKLSKMELFKENAGQLILIRGTKRAMLVEPQWGTVCVNSLDYDGENLTDTKIEKLFSKLFSNYIEDRFINP
jgi:hypothetical protein